MTINPAPKNNKPIVVGWNRAGIMPVALGVNQDVFSTISVRARATPLPIMTIAVKHHARRVRSLARWATTSVCGLAGPLSAIGLITDRVNGLSCGPDGVFSCIAVSRRRRTITEETHTAIEIVPGMSSCNLLLPLTCAL